MVKAWLYENPSVAVTKEELDKLGVFSYKIDADNYEKEGKLDQLCKERSYGHRSEICCSVKTLTNFDEMLGKFFTE